MGRPGVVWLMPRQSRAVGSWSLALLGVAGQGLTAPGGCHGVLGCGWELGGLENWVRTGWAGSAPRGLPDRGDYSGNCGGLLQ